MSITAPDDRITTYNPVVATTEFAAEFPVFDNDDIKVFVDGVERTDFAVSATYVKGISTDAAAVLDIGVTGKVQVVGFRDPRRTNRFQEGAPLPVWQQNLALDTLEAEMQETSREAGRQHKAPYGEQGGVFSAADIGNAQEYAAQALQHKNDAAGSASDASDNAAAAALALAQLDAVLDGVQFVGDGAAFPQGRLSLASGVAVPSADIAGATTIYYLPANGRYVPVWNGLAIIPVNIAAGLSLALTGNPAHSGMQYATLNYDLFVFDDAGTIRLATGPAWTVGAVAGSDTARGTGANSTELTQVEGLLVNANAFTLRFGASAGDTVVVPAGRATYVGSVRPSANGQASDTKAKRLLFNAYSKTTRAIGVQDVASTWTYNTNAWRQANGNANNKVEMLFGLAGVAVAASAACLLNSQTVGGGVAIGLDSTTVKATGSLAGFIFNQTGVALTKYATAEYSGVPDLGYHYLAWLERGGGSQTQTWYGSNNDTAVWGTGLVGTMLN